MKKLLALILGIILLLSVLSPVAVYATSYDSDYRSEVPMIMLSGDGEVIYDADGNQVYSVRDLPKIISGTDDQENDEEDSSVKDAVVNVLKPMLLEGVLLNRWDNYYNALYNEITDLFRDIIPDENGEITNGTDISEWSRWTNWVNMYQENKAADDGTFGFEDYHFFYDWRRDPLDIADDLNEYINRVRIMTGAPKVAVVTRCLGANVLLSYIAKYGTDALHGVGFDGASSNGCESISGALSGKFAIDGNSISRFLDDSSAFGLFSVSPFISATLEMLENTGVLDGLTAAARITIYRKIEKGVVSALARSTLFTMPCYWALVCEEDYETAKEYVFGPEGSEMRRTYAGLIEKLDNYDETVRKHIVELVSSIPESGANLTIISKYGAQILPISKDADLVADQFASVTRSSFGATTSRIGETLTDEYIESRIVAGFGDYISPDKQIDASTCLFPEYTYFVKGVRHSDWSRVENNIMEQTLTADHRTVVGDFGYPRFIVAHTDSDAWEPMTEENCHTENWADEAMPVRGFFEKIKRYFSSLKKWFAMLFDIMKNARS